MSTTYTTLMPSLEFNGRLKQFESFFSHQGIPFMFNFAGEFISVRNEQQEVDGENGSETKYTTTLWLNNKGKYGEFYGRYHDSQIEYYVNPDAMTDKVFDNLQYRMDAYKRNGENNEWEYDPMKTFDTVEVYNEYQYGYLNLDVNDRRPNIRKKFMVWNTPIPRQKSVYGQSSSYETQNRIRST